MKTIIALATLLLLAVSTISAQKDAPVARHATGTFDVKITPLDPAFKFDENPITRFSSDKQIHGDLEATSKGEMLAGGGPAKGSGGYVAIERISGTLQGRAGTFLLQHNGTMQNGVYHLNVVVVPDSGTGQLAGLDGKMEIIIKDGKHFYDFAYNLPAK